MKNALTFFLLAIYSMDFGLQSYEMKNPQTSTEKDHSVSHQDLTGNFNYQNFP